MKKSILKSLLLLPSLSILYLAIIISVKILYSMGPSKPENLDYTQRN